MPFAVETPDRIPKARYVDEDFHRLEAEQLWSRVWQMACRLEEIPEPDDVVAYDCGDQSVIVVRTADGGVRAFQNACRHRGVRLVDGPGSCAGGFTCPFHGWGYAPDGTNTRIPGRKQFAEHNLRAGDVDLVPVRCETWGGCAWINLDADAPPLRESLEPAASILDAWKVESLRTEWWRACRLPVNWKLGVEAFVESYHVVQTHPQLVIPTRYGRRDRRRVRRSRVRRRRPRVPAHDERGHGRDGPCRRRARRGAVARRRVAGRSRRRDRHVEPHAERRGRGAPPRAGADVPDLNDLAARGLDQEFFHCFPHYFVLPMYSSATAYRFRPLGPEETLMEIWSLTRSPDGRALPRPTPPEVWPPDDPRWPPIPAQDFSNLPRQQRGLHARGFEYMRLAAGLEGHISNFERTIDGYLAGRPGRDLLPALRRGQPLPVRPPDRGPRLLMGADASTFAAVAEGVRATIAAYTHALDDGRTDDVVATFCADGVCAIPGMGTHEGHDALRAAYTRWTPRRPQRHLVVNTHVHEWSDDEAHATSDVVFLLQGDDGWSVQLVGRYHDVLRREGDTWRFARRDAEFVQ